MRAQDAVLVLEQVPGLQGSVVRRNVRDIVADKVASLIASGILRLGDVLPSERDLAAAFQVSRETVRGGMQILAARGIIEVSHGARTRVISTDVGSVATGLLEPKLINSYDIESIHAARLLVERSVVAEAATRISEQTLDLLSDALGAQRSAIDDPVGFLISDREFHLAIYRSCGNPVLADFVGDLYAYMMEHRREAVSRPGAIFKSYQDHVAIIAGLRARDPNAVVAAFDVHLERIYATTIDIIGGSEPNSNAPHDDGSTGDARVVKSIGSERPRTATDGETVRPKERGKKARHRKGQSAVGSP
jgi:DNA-binding FadR family transcriptional regulator